MLVFDIYVRMFNLEKYPISARKLIMIETKVVTCFQISMVRSCIKLVMIVLIFENSTYLQKSNATRRNGDVDTIFLFPAFIFIIWSSVILMQRF